ncbi:MAG: ATP-binding protein, partial [Chloroflexota bacterium]
VQLIERLAPDLGLVMVDPTQVQQVILNIVVNARDAMPAGGTLTIETSNIDSEIDGSFSSGVVGRCVVLMFRDSGTGMDQATMERIFEPFYTTKELGKGTGLGLATVHGIVRQSGGDILVESEPGVGTTLRVILPRLPDGITVQPTVVARKAASLGSETVLLVEDEPGVRSLTATMLRRGGYRVIEAAGGPEALAACRAYDGGIDLLVTDVVMPGMSGPELATEFRRLYPAAGLMFMSGHTDDLIARHGLQSEHTLLLGKPFARDRLLGMVRTALDARS